MLPVKAAISAINRIRFKINERIKILSVPNFLQIY